MNLFQRSFHLSQFIFPNGGACLEFGVFRGGTYAYQAEHILRRYPASTLIGFDSWEGLPPETEGVWTADRHAVGKYAAPKAEVKSRLDALGIKEGDPRFRLVDGFYSDSLTPEVAASCGPLAYVNIDVDIHSSTVEVLEFIGPILRPGVILYWDDWKDPRDQADGAWGEHYAWEQWLPKQAGLEVETIEVNPLEQRSMLVTAAYGKTLASENLPTVTQIRYQAQALVEDPVKALKPRSDNDGMTALKRQIRTLPVVGAVVKKLRDR
ncbi:MAG: TylF/MycF/NovP-related O-methyltransferase [Brevundimonas sp.]|uniref:TylF/MycF/NovP-related O-methyltransferase n=1 Tax=Brevundimonas sp. TaxID=1871086 RepID=UPI00300341D0